MDFEYVKVLDVPIFKYGMADSGKVFIPEEVVKDCLKDFKTGKIPIVRGTEVTGMIYSIDRYEDNMIYGDIIMFSKSEPVFDTFINYQIQLLEYHEVDGVLYVDKMRIFSVYLANKSVYDMLDEASKE